MLENPDTGVVSSLNLSPALEAILDCSGDCICILEISGVDCFIILGCGNSVHPSCRVYSADLKAHFQKEGWTCDDCKTCIVCNESQTNVSF